MTGRTHDLAAFTALAFVALNTPLEKMSLATVLVAFSANMLGGLAPDIDQPTAEMWDKVRGGNTIGKLIYPLLGGHRFISHSLLGVALFGFVLDKILKVVGTVLLVDMNVIWWAFMIGFVSHLIMDTFTKEGVAWLFPIPWRFGIPPLRALRITTGKLIEKSIVFPGLIILNFLLFYIHYDKVLEFLREYIK